MTNILPKIAKTTEHHMNVTHNVSKQQCNTHMNDHVRNIIVSQHHSIRPTGLLSINHINEHINDTTNTWVSQSHQCINVSTLCCNGFTNQSALVKYHQSSIISTIISTIISMNSKVNNHINQTYQSTMCQSYQPQSMCNYVAAQAMHKLCIYVMIKCCIDKFVIHSIFITFLRQKAYFCNHSHYSNTGLLRDHLRIVEHFPNQREIFPPSVKKYF